MPESRAGFAGIVIILAVIIFGFGIKSSASQNKNSSDLYISKSVVFLFALLLILIAIVLLGDGVVERFSSSYTVLGERPVQWMITLNAIFERPLIGYGGGVLMQLCLRYTAKATHCVKLFMIKRTTNICTFGLSRVLLG
jgi:O-antigen ligase